MESVANTITDNQLHSLGIILLYFNSQYIYIDLQAILAHQFHEVLEVQFHLHDLQHPCEKEN